MKSANGLAALIALYLAAVAIYVSAIPPLPTTIPAGYDPASYAAGWTGAVASTQPTTFPSTVATQPIPTDVPTTQPTSQPTTAPSTQPATAPALQPADLAPILATIRPGVNYLSPAAYTYVGTFPLLAGEVIDGTGSTLTCRGANGASTTTIFHAVGPGAGVQNFADVHCTGVFFLSDSPNWIFSGNHISQADRALQFNDAAANGICRGNVTVHTNSMSIYGSGDNPDIEGNTLGPSAGEARLRIDVKSKKRPNGQFDRPVNGLIAGNTIVGPNGFLKPDIELRSCDNFIVRDNPALGELLIGQLPVKATATSPAVTYTLGSACTGITVLRNTFSGADPGVNPIMIRQGVSGAVVNGNTFTADVALRNTPPIAIDVFSSLTTSGNTQVRPPSMATIKPLVAASEQARWKGDGTDTVMAAPTTQPASQPSN